MQNSIEIKNLTKKYKENGIYNISFNVPKGSIVGLIGRNGAGKTTILNSILNIIKKDNGEITIFDDKTFSKDTRNKLGVVFDKSMFPESLNAKEINNILKYVYSNWNEMQFFDYLKKLEIPLNKKIKEFSKGMEMKLYIAIALSHNAKCLILDEATSGLDPVIRDEILDLFLDFIQDESNSILISSHITSDLEKIADYIAFIDNGNLLFFESKDKLIYEYGILKCEENNLEKIDEKYILKKLKKSYGYDLLINNKNELKEFFPNLTIDNCSIDEIMVIYTKGSDL